MLAIIPARGGSKGLPGKNIRPLGGEPLIVHTVKAALAAKHVTRVVISTDDDEIAAVCQAVDKRVEIPFMRPPELASDTALIIDTYLYTMNRINEEFGGDFSSMMALLPTCPFRNAEDIDGAIKIFREREADSVVSYYEAEHPVQWYRYIDDNGVLRSVMPEGDRLANRQSERKSYLPNGGLYIFKKSLLEDGKYYSDRSYPYIMPVERSVDIDTLFDFRKAEMMLEMSRN